jgi:hypothetical protein
MKKTMLALYLVAAASAGAAGPRKMIYQGLLRDGTGQQVNVTIGITFRLYSTPSGGSALWTETQPSVIVSKDVFTVTLGAVVPLDLPFDRPYYLGVTVGAGSEITPRPPLTSAAYAFRSSQADALRPNAVTTAVIQDGTVTPDRLANSCAIGEILMRTPTGWLCATFP